MHLTPPLTPDAQSARRLLRAELADPAYHRDDPSWLTRGLRAAGRWLLDLFDAASGSATNRWALAVVVLALLVGMGLVIRHRPAWSARRRAAPLFGAVRLTAADHRRAADDAARSGLWETAVRERLRAIIRGLEERAVLDERPGRTATEAANAAAAALPGCANALHEGAERFDAVCYGGRPATAADDAALRALEGSLRSARVQVPVAVS